MSRTSLTSTWEFPRGRRPVAEARGEAAAAMDAIFAAVKAHGLTDDDIQTTSFNIWPQYDWVESEEDGQRVGRQVLVGYEVTIRPG